MGDDERSPEGPATLEALMAADDWQEAMHYAIFTFNDIKKIVFAEEGDNDGPDWLLIVELRDGRFGALHAGCDYSGWDCQAGGDSTIHPTPEAARDWLFNASDHDSRIPPINDIQRVPPLTLAIEPLPLRKILIKGDRPDA